jgi:hypothetical protein
MNQEVKNPFLRTGARHLAWFGLFAACVTAPQCWAQLVVHPLAGETLALRTTSPETSIVSFKGATTEAIRYQLPFQVSSVSKLYAEGQRALLVGATGLFEFGASYAVSAQDGKPDGVMIGHGFSIAPKADYLAWVQFFPRMALDPDRGTLRLMKMTDAVRLKAPADELSKQAGVVLFHAPSEEILLYPNLTWSDDGRLAFLSQGRAGQVKIVVCRVANLQCQSVGSVEVDTVDKNGKHHMVNQVTKIDFVPKGISLDLVSSSSKEIKKFFPTSF